MLFHQTSILPRCFSPFSAVKVGPSLHPLSSFNIRNTSFGSTHGIFLSNFFSSSPSSSLNLVKSIPCSVNPRRSDSEREPEPEPERSLKAKTSPKARSCNQKNEVTINDDKITDEFIPTTIPRKPRRGHRSEAVAVEDFIRDSLERTFASIQQQSPEVWENMENVLKEKYQCESCDNDEEEEEETGDSGGTKMVIEEESKSWPLDADVGWGIRASEYFEQHPIKNVVEDGVEIDWEGEIDDNWVQEINCLEWENFAFHPSPLIVLVFERYNRAMDNWKILKELERALKVYWSAKDRLPPRAVKIDINIERDLAYALKVRECPEILFLRGNRIMYKEKGLRTADELIQMIAFFYYNAKKPSWIDDKALNFHY